MIEFFFICEYYFSWHIFILWILARVSLSVQLWGATRLGTQASLALPIVSGFQEPDLTLIHNDVGKLPKNTLQFLEVAATICCPVRVCVCVSQPQGLCHSVNTTEDQPLIRMPQLFFKKKISVGGSGSRVACKQTPRLWLHNICQSLQLSGKLQRHVLNTWRMHFIWHPARERVWVCVTVCAGVQKSGSEDALLWCHEKQGGLSADALPVVFGNGL